MYPSRPITYINSCTAIRSIVDFFFSSSFYHNARLQRHSKSIYYVAAINKE